MNRIALAIALTLVAGAAGAQTYVNPYFRSDGTYVEGHHRSSPNSTTLDNYSTRGNVNPYNGHQGTVNPYAPSQQPHYQPYRIYR